MKETSNMRPVDKSMTPYSFYKLPFEQQLEKATMNLLNDYAFYSHNMENRRKLLISADPKWEQLESKLLAIGGKSVCCMADPHIEELVTKGEKFAGKSTTVKGRPSDCHYNVCTLWIESKPSKFKIVTGWALTKDDGIWRQHTFGRLNGNITIETTVKRQKYFGAVLDDISAYIFCIQNHPEFHEKQLKDKKSLFIKYVADSKIEV